MHEIGASMMSNDPAQQQMRDCFLVFCRTVNTITALCASLCLVAQVMAVCVQYRSPILMDMDRIYQQLIRMFAAVLCVVVVLVETEWERLMAMMRILEFWVMRGLLQVFLALLTLELATAGGDSDFSKSVRLYRLVSGCSLMVCGIFYILGGCCCFAALKKARHRRIVERMKAHADLLMIEKQREDLRNLLSSDV
mmetsp:Transcript_28317/g.50580  ORF Transcript_28317/g.50580 Transcript_28317/m.50580 type:complete len:195 (-) Transcript_28317:161-745(-)